MSREVVVPKFGCASCGRVKTVRMGERGPVKVDLERRRVGHFLFCVECLGSSTQTVERRGDANFHLLTMNAGPAKGERWVTSTEPAQ